MEGKPIDTLKKGENIEGKGEIARQQIRRWNINRIRT